jgi:hypothetical protein
VGFVVDKAALGQVSSKYFGFPCQSISPTAPFSSSSIIVRGWYNRPVVASVPFHPKKYKEEKQSSVL